MRMVLGLFYHFVFINFFPLFRLSFFLSDMMILVACGCDMMILVACGCIFSYNFIPNILKRFRCFYHGFKVCLSFGYSPHVNVVF